MGAIRQCQVEARIVAEPGDPEAMLVFVVLCCAVAKRNTPNQLRGAAINRVVYLISGCHLIWSFRGAGSLTWILLEFRTMILFPDFGVREG